MAIKKNLILIYDEFHERTKLPKRIIGRKNFTYRLILEILESYLEGNKKVLDIGCGVGSLSFYIAKKGSNVTGIDISPAAIKICKVSRENFGLSKNTSFQAVDFLKSKLDKHFDLILCSEVLEHLIDDQLAVQKILKILKIGGIAIITVPSRNAPLFRLGFIKRFDETVGHLRRYKTDQLIDFLRKSNFKILKVKRTEGILRNFLFTSRFGGQIIRVANRFVIISDILTFFDNITLRLFGESQIIVVAQKPEEEEK